MTTTPTAAPAGLTFILEQRGPTWVIDWSAKGGAGCRPATDSEVELWNALSRQVAAPEAAGPFGSALEDALQSYWNAGFHEGAGGIASAEANAALARIRAVVRAYGDQRAAQARAMALEEAAKVCDERFDDRAKAGLPREASAYRSAAAAVRALAAPPHSSGG